MVATLIIRGWSVSLIIRFIPERRCTSCNCPLRSLMFPHFGMKVRISYPFSCIACGTVFPITANSVSGTYGIVSWLMNNTLFAILFNFCICKGTKNYGEIGIIELFLDFLASYLAYFHDISFLFDKNVVILHPFSEHNECRWKFFTR